MSGDGKEKWPSAALFAHKTDPFTIVSISKVLLILTYITDITDLYDNLYNWFTTASHIIK